MNIYDKYSWILVPLTIYLYYFYPNLRPYLLYFMVYISLIGTLDTILVKNKILNTYKITGKIIYYLTLIFHIILLGALYTFPKDGFPNLISFALMIFVLGFSYITPHWPYFNTRNFFGISYILVYIILSIAYMLLASWRLLRTGA